MPGKKILLLDDDVALLRLLEAAFIEAGYQVYTATSSEAGLRQFFDSRPDVIVLEVIMSDTAGWETCRILRQLSEEVVIIILSGRGSKADILRGLKEGADDYLIKPYDFELLIAKVHAHLRRTRLPSPEPLTYHDSYLTLNLNTRQVLAGGRSIRLTKTEHELLAYLFRHAGQILSLQQIFESVWGWNGEQRPEVVHTYIGRLRQKLGETAKAARYILTEHGIGYRFQKQT